jgi:hypothetical protein
LVLHTYVLRVPYSCDVVTALPMEREGAKPLEGRVARLILLVVVSVCVVFCVLCCLQNNPAFTSVTISHILKNENYELCF